ncbi:hypothetical protein GFL54_18985 [Rhizobium laguerreae]|uniref:hypothetical protein n=1 Tax=Rhizobium laguerreae TaxID=1076926 RepID=UPI00143FAC69|nr:hypothetical protein [Rhizobium laguerreae]NKM86348.1 hypothetical protein [Rhizobium laguerreae]
MDLTVLQTALGLATSAVGLTGKAADVANSVKALMSSGKPADTGEAANLLNVLAVELTSANMMNVQLSEALRRLSEELRKEDQFEKELARYQLEQTAVGDLVYKIREDMREGQPVHFVCPACVRNDRKIIFIQGSGDYKRCQVNTHHLYQFSETDWRQTRSDDEYSPF